MKVGRTTVVWRRIAGLLLAVCHLGPAAVSADPRWWTDDEVLPFGSEVMLTRVLRQLNLEPRQCVVVAAPGQALPDLPPGVLVARDDCPGRGPLEGLLAGLKTGRGIADAFYATGCDVPLLRSAWVRGLFDLLSIEHDIVVPCDGRYHHPLAAVYRPNVVPTIERLLAEDRRRPARPGREAPGRTVEAS